MKTLIATLLLMSSVGFAQDNSAAQQGIAIVEQMEKDLPEFCKSTKASDKKACDAWLEANARFQRASTANENPKLPEFCKSTKKKDKVACERWMKANARFQKSPSDPEEPDLAAAHQGIAIMRQMELDEAKEEASKPKKKQKNCEDPRLTEEEQYFCRLKQYEVSSSEDRLVGCVMSMDSREITCGDKVYTLSGQVSNGSRINTKVDLESSSRPKKGQSGHSKANKQ